MVLRERRRHGRRRRAAHGRPARRDSESRASRRSWGRARSSVPPKRVDEPGLEAHRGHDGPEAPRRAVDADRLAGGGSRRRARSPASRIGERLEGRIGGDGDDGRDGHARPRARARRGRPARTTSREPGDQRDERPAEQQPDDHPGGGGPEHRVADRRERRLGRARRRSGRRRRTARARARRRRTTSWRLRRRATTATATSPARARIVLTRLRGPGRRAGRSCAPPSSAAP